MEKENKKVKHKELTLSRSLAIIQFLFLFFLISSIVYYSTTLSDDSDVGGLFVILLVMTITLNLSLLLILIVLQFKSIVVYSIKIKSDVKKIRKKMYLRLMFLPLIFAFYYKNKDFSEK